MYIKLNPVIIIQTVGFYVILVRLKLEKCELFKLINIITQRSLHHNYLVRRVPMSICLLADKTLRPPLDSFVYRKY